MGGFGYNKKYESYKIPGRDQNPTHRDIDVFGKTTKKVISDIADGLFYELEYGSSPVNGVGKYTLKPQKVEDPKNDPIRERFIKMRGIASAQHSKYDYNSFFERRFQYDNAEIFYKQAKLMRDFTDDYTGNAAFSQYFPNYQMMSYDQLRTYFTWRSQVRKGFIFNISLPYALLYAYELLANIEADDFPDGLNKLLAFWKGYGVYNKSLDKYMIRWLKDYHIYYELPQSFSKFVKINGLTEFYPKVYGIEDEFDLLCAISKYDIRESNFFTAERSRMITKCVNFTIDVIRQVFKASGMDFDNAFFRPAKKSMRWTPFKDALFFNWLKQPDRRVVFSENEIYICKDNEWYFSPSVTSEKGRQFIGYVMKKTESVLRQAAKYKYKLTANINMVNADTLRVLIKAGVFIDEIIPAAVLTYHREASKTIVTVDHASLARIRQETLVTQEALIIEDTSGSPEREPFAVQEQSIFADPPESEIRVAENAWDDLKGALYENELKALAVIARGDDVKVFADECGIMIEVLLDGINEKAMDHIGDSLIDESFAIYDDYIDKVRELIE